MLKTFVQISGFFTYNTEQNLILYQAKSRVVFSKIPFLMEYFKADTLGPYNLFVLECL